MKGFFEMKEFDFEKRLTELIPEMKEEYYYGDQKQEPEESEIKKGVILLCCVFSYVKRMDYRYWDVDQMAECLRLIVVENEARFLSDKTESGRKEAVLRQVKEGRNKRIAVIAAQLLEYYNSTYRIDVNFSWDLEFSIVMHNIIMAGTELACIGQRQANEILDIGFPLKLKNYLDEFVVGQEKLKKTLVMTVYHYLLMGIYQPVMMIGDTGTGKNYTIGILGEYLEKNCGIPVIIYDVSRITPNGFDGDSVKNIIRLFKQRARQIGAGTERGIIYLDEICKIVLPNMDNHNRDVNALVQFQLLSMLSGTIIEEVDTSKLLLILGGAFADLKKLRMEKRSKKKVGFLQECETLNINTLRDDLIKIGMQREFLGRISTIVEMERLNRDQIKRILLHEKTGPIVQKKKEYALDGLELVIDEDVPDVIMDKVMQENLGARSALNILDGLLGCYSFDMLEQGYKIIRIHSGMILNSEAPVFERSESYDEDKRYSR